MVIDMIGGFALLDEVRKYFSSVRQASLLAPTQINTHRDVELIRTTTRLTLHLLATNVHATAWVRKEKIA
jgi:hypothetical protein